MCSGHGPERPVSEGTFGQLAASEQGVLWAARLWFKARHEPQRVLPAVRRALEDIGAPESAVVELAGLMGVLAMDGARSPTFRCVRCNRLGLDEEALLEALAACQDGDDATAEKVFGRWLPALTVSVGVGFARGFARALAAAGLRIPCRRPLINLPSPTDAGPGVALGFPALGVPA